jgi:putative acetyltransferase
LTARREDLWRELGPEVRARYDAFAAASPVHLTTPHLHLHMIGVRHAAHGRGYARQLLDHVHAFSRGDPESNGVSLTTETEANLTLYRHFGYHLVGRMQVSPDLTTWGFFRRDDNAPRVAGLHVRKMQPDDREPLVELWERSVRATHHFLGEADIAGLRPYVAGALASHAVGWWVAESSANVLVGFLGFVDPVIDALFIDPEYFRQGAGKLLVAHAERLASGPLSLDVNEQNEDAVTFYTAMGFAVVGRSPTDSAGRPFPLLHMRRRQ